MEEKKTVGLPADSLSKQEQVDCSRKQHITSAPSDQPPSINFLIGSTVGHELLADTCPSAKTLVGFSLTLDRWCVIQIRCKRWGCRHCGQRKTTHLGWRCEDAMPNRLITLTVNNTLWETPRDAYERTKGKVTQLATRLRRVYGEFEYLRVLEVTKLGWPHYHLIVRSGYIPQKVLSSVWSDLTGAFIVDVRKIKKRQDVYFYVVKYLSKQRYIPWTNRRVSWSRDFFDKTPFDKPDGLKLRDVGWFDDHPERILQIYWKRFLITSFGRDCWLLPEGKGERIGKPMRLKSKKNKKD